MRYRSATVAGLHGLPCDCRIKWKEPQERADTTAAPPHPASPNPVHPLTMTGLVEGEIPAESLAEMAQQPRHERDSLFERRRASETRPYTSLDSHKACFHIIKS